MNKGYNKANLTESILWLLQKSEIKDRPCVFLSHKKEDKPECKKIAEYLKAAEIDYYLDELDDDLQLAVQSNDPLKITESIKRGIRESSHMLVVISEKTYKSHWVPFEVGYGHSAILDKVSSENAPIDRIKLSILTLKDISEKTLPDFMQVGYIIRGTKSLNDYIATISGELEKFLINERRLFSNKKLEHPLDSVLNWSL